MGRNLQNLGDSENMNLKNINTVFHINLDCFLVPQTFINLITKGCQQGHWMSESGVSIQRSQTNRIQSTIQSLRMQANAFSLE
jgi:hypothetical protein